MVAIRRCKVTGFVSTAKAPIGVGVSAKKSAPRRRRSFSVVAFALRNQTALLQFGKMRERSADPYTLGHFALDHAGRRSRGNRRVGILRAGRGRWASRSAGHRRASRYRSSECARDLGRSRRRNSAAARPVADCPFSEFSECVAMVERIFSNNWNAIHEEN